MAEFTYRPGKCQRDYRVVVVRKNISRSKDDKRREFGGQRVELRPRRGRSS